MQFPFTGFSAQKLSELKGKNFAFFVQFFTEDLTFYLKKGVDLMGCGKCVRNSIPLLHWMLTSRPEATLFRRCFATKLDEYLSLNMSLLIKLRLKQKEICFYLDMEKTFFSFIVRFFCYRFSMPPLLCHLILSEKGRLDGMCQSCKKFHTSANIILMKMGS